MSAPRRTGISGRWIVPALALTLAPLATPVSPSAHAQTEEAGRQVTLFGIVATPNSTLIDPKLARIETQLRKLLPNHGFKLLDVQSKRLSAGQTLSASLGNGFVAETELIQPLDPNGKVQLRCGLAWNQVTQFETLVSTPPNQLFFCDKMLVDGSRLLVGIGAR